MSKINDPILEVFIFETNQLIDKLEEILIEGEKSSGLSKESINEVFRCMHTIKGSSAMMSFNNISKLTHSIEDLFAFIRANENYNYNWSEICDLVLAVVDFTKEEIAKIEQGLDSDKDETKLANEIRVYLSGLTGDNKKNKVNKYKAIITFEDDCKMENIRAFAVINSLKDLCTEIKTNPENLLDSDDSSREFIINNGFYIEMTSEEEENKLRQVIEQTLFLKTYEFEQITESDDKKGSKDLPRQNDQQESNAANNGNTVNTNTSAINSKQNFISVNVAKLDRLLDLVGELVIAESMVTRIQDPLKFDPEAFEKSARHLKKMTEELQDVVMSVRMIPIAATFNRMQRLVRDMCKKTGKEVELIIKGEETEVDKNIIDNLTDPLMHIIRNSVDHGIESREDRLKLNKPAHGRLLLEAHNSGGEVFINIVDDGAGLNKEKIIKKAISKGLIKDMDANISDKEAYSLIMQPGFSTNDTVTEFSGRGVGMDVVKKSIEKIGGSVLIDSKVNKGTAITLKIPLTLAIIGGMTITAGNQLFIIPTLSIKETFVAKKENIIREPGGNELIMLRGECYPVIRLHEIFHIENAEKDLEKGKIVLLESDNKIICIFVDDIIEDQQVVFKPVPEFILNTFGTIPGISGCTILGDGSARLVIDVNTLSQI